MRRTVSNWRRPSASTSRAISGSTAARAVLSVTAVSVMETPLVAWRPRTQARDEGWLLTPLPGGRSRLQAPVAARSTLAADLAGPAARLAPRLPVEPVAGVAQAGDDEAALVEAVVDRGHRDRDLRMGGSDPLDALGRRDQAHEPKLARARRRQDIQRRDGRAASRDHHLEHDDVVLGQVRRKPLRVGRGLQGRLVAAQPEEADARVLR